MPIYDEDGVRIRPYLNKYEPLDVYADGAKIEGYHDETQSGNSASFSHTYNDSAEVELFGNTVQASDYYAKGGLSSQVTTVQGKNLFDGSRRILGQFVYGVDGGLNPSSVSDSSEFVSILPNTFYTLSNFTTVGTDRAMCFYTLSKTFISGVVDSVTISVQAPSNAYYARFSMGKAVVSICQLELGSTATAYAPFVPNSPSPEYPSPITSNLPAGTYKYTSTDGIYEFTLAEELRGIGTALDKVVFDRKSHSGVLERRNNNILITDTDSIAQRSDLTLANSVYFEISKANGHSDIAVNDYATLSSHFVGQSIVSIDREGGSVYRYLICFRILKSRLTTQDVAGFKAWISLNPVTVVYQLTTPTRTPLTFTKVSSSSAPECPMAFLTSTPSLDYPAQVYDVSGNLLSNDAAVCALPALSKVGAVADSFVPKTGVKTKRISDWEIIDGGKLFYVMSTYYSSIKRFWLPYSAFCKPHSDVLLLKNTSEPIINGVTTTVKDRVFVDSIGNLLIAIGVDDCGISDALTPTTGELKAYFFGWKMCNADGTSPYYKSEVPYSPSTWAELGLVGVTGSLCGVTFTANGSTYYQIRFLNLAIKPSTKYGFIYDIVSSTFNAGNLYNDPSTAFPFGVYPIVVGLNKRVITSNNPISNNLVNFVVDGVNTPSGRILTIKDIRVFELPAGSQIEADFTNLTADQLAAKYTFNGLCPKNWKHVTGGLGQTAVLPTASYDGYTPYKMLYELATPVTEQYTPAPVPTYYPSTVIETDCVNAIPTITAIAKVEDS